MPQIASTHRFWWILSAGIGVGLLGGIVLAFTAANTVPDTRAGVGEGDITGYVVTSVHYDLSSSDPTKIDAVSFQLQEAPPPGSSVQIRLVSTGSTWYECSFAGTSVTCDTTSPTADVLAADQLTVVTAQ